MPRPKKNENKEHWMDRCVPMVMDDGAAEDSDQAVAMCMTMWKEHNEQKSAPVGGRETRHFDLSLETRADGKRILRGLPIVFNSRSSDLGGFVEIVAPEAVKRTLEEDDIRGLFNHDSNMILGRTKAGTMSLRATREGVAMEIELPSSPAGETVAEAVRRGDISGGSFGFIAVKEEWEDAGKRSDGQKDLPIRTLREVKLYDVGPVVFPAYPETSMAMRSLEEWRKAHEAPAPEPESDAEAVARELEDLKLRLDLAGAAV